MTTITRENAEIKSFITGFLSDPAHDNQSTDSLLANVFRIAQASLEAEPIGEVSEKRYGLVMDGTVDLGGKSTYRIIKGEKAMKLLPLGTKFYTAPPAPVIQADIAQAIENLKQKLVECNRYNYCADAVKGVEDASRVLALQYQNMSTPITPEAIENAIEYIRSIAFHIDEDDYHGKHIAYFMRQALAWLEGHSCSDDRLGKAENQTVHGNQAAESNRGNEWTGNPDIDNAIIMLDRIDTLESCDDDRIEAVKAVLRRLAGNSPVTPDGWVMVPKELTPEMMRAVQIRSELGGYATSNLSGAYNMFSEFWNVAVSAAPKVDDL
ncbi:DUF551 domain-containing protein [Escherichia coli]|uniref:DUF551 domain-containing protein n=1 Tax=Escherichia coli TaxID=562 RepID=A0A2H4TWI8_ECOLX|nr:hypothetical protein CV83915_03631 [Escherichia coli]EEU9338333.1 DUF551 domain-containing protein [Escherichia coli]EGK5192221.1 DUF551 domain-containing protein [Escherichia coli]